MTQGVIEGYGMFELNHLQFFIVFYRGAVPAGDMAQGLELKEDVVWKVLWGRRMELTDYVQ